MSSPDGPFPLVISARGDRALKREAARLRELAGGDPPVSPADIARSLFEADALFDHRAVVVADRRDDMISGLEALARSEEAANIVTGAARPVDGVVFVFPGQGSQWTGMGLDLLGSNSAFTRQMNECADALLPYTGWSVLDVIRSADARLLQRVDIVQPTLWAIMLSLVAVWETAGIRPDAVVGHSQGEVAAAYAAGALSLDDAARIIALRSKACARLGGTGAMASISLPARTVAADTASLGGQISVAAVNAASATVVSGEPAAVKELVSRYLADGVRARTIAVDYASHAPGMEVIRDEIMDALAKIRPTASRIAFCSTVTGKFLDDTSVLDAAYWYRNIRNTVCFSAAIEELGEHGYGAFLEISPHPVLTAAIRDNVHGERAVGATLRRYSDSRRQLLMSAGELFTQGMAVNWRLLVNHVAR